MRLVQNLRFLSDYFNLQLYIKTNPRKKKVIIYSDNELYFYVVIDDEYSYYYDLETTEYCDLPALMNEALYYIVSTTANFKDYS